MAEILRPYGPFPSSLIMQLASIKQLASIMHFPPIMPTTSIVLALVTNGDDESGAPG